MAYKAGFVLLAVLAGCFALPTPENDVSQYFAGRIVGGTIAAVGAHPYQVALSSGVMIRSYFCGGSLIGTRTVLTAAHCIEHVFIAGSLTGTLRTTVGTNIWNSGGTDYTVARNVTHPHYVRATIKNDIGLLITNNNVILSTLVQTVPLSYSWVAGGVASRVAGWGRIRHLGPISNQLLYLDVNTIEGEDCKARVAQAGVDSGQNVPPIEPHIELCTLQAPGFGTCNGDSGSALIRRETGQQIGVVSWGFPCANGIPDMYVRVSGFQEFVEENTV